MDFLEVFEENEFDETPVPLKEFVESPDYLGMPPLSDKQYELCERLTQIYKPETNREIYGRDYADYLNKLKIKEVVAQIGKGGGKNHTTITAVCRVIYLLLCLRDPAAYYGKPRGDGIHILNVAVNANQANNTFFKPLLQRIKQTTWFDGKYTAKSGEIQFDKNVTAYSGHSEREAWEGYNLIFVVLDEIAAFKTDAESTGRNDRSATASGLYRMYKASVTSRFPDVGKLALLSFPRFKGDYITQRYNEVVAESIKDNKTYKFQLHDDGGWGDDNTFTVDWEEENIVSYTEPYVYALRCPSWEFNPSRNIEEYKMEFWRDPVDALSRFACNPPESVDAFFNDRSRVEESFKRLQQPFEQDWSFKDWFQPKEGKQYYIHVDLAQKSDRAAVAMAHVESWKEVSYGATKSVEPVVEIDCVRWWTPSRDRSVEFSDVKEFVLSLRRRGFDIRTVTFDRWAGSIGLVKELEYAGMSVETLSVQKNEYNNLKFLIYEDRIIGYHIPLLIDELVALKVMPNGKVDHPRSGTNDLADAMCGAVYLSTANSEYRNQKIIDVEYLAPREISTTNTPEETNKKRPPRHMPEDLKDYLGRIRSI